MDHYCSNHSCESFIKHLEEYAEKGCYYHIILLVYIKGMYTDFFKMDAELSPRIHSCDPIIIRTKKRVEEIFTFYNIFNDNGRFDTSPLLRNNFKNSLQGYVNFGVEKDEQSFQITIGFGSTMGTLKHAIKNNDHFCQEMPKPYDFKLSESPRFDFLSQGWVVSLADKIDGMLNRHMEELKYISLNLQEFEFSREKVAASKMLNLKN